MGTNKKQTAVSWLKDQIIDNKDIYIEGNTLMIPNDIFRKAQQIEREQMINFYGQGVADTSGEITDATKDANQYYELFYGKET